MKEKHQRNLSGVWFDFTFFQEKTCDRPESPLCQHNKSQGDLWLDLKTGLVT